MAASKKQRDAAAFRLNSAVLWTLAARRREASETRKRLEAAARECG